MIPELESFKMPILSLVTLTPALGALLLTLIDRNNKALIRQIALMVSFLGLLFSLIMVEISMQPWESCKWRRIFRGSNPWGSPTIWESMVSPYC